MKLRMDSKVLKKLAMAAVVSWACVATVAGVDQLVSAQDNASGQYKIAVVDRKKVFDEYNKKKTEWAALEAERTKAEADLNAKLDALQARKKDYETKRDGMTEEARAAEETKLNTDIQSLQAEGRSRQAELNRKGEVIIKRVTGEINDAIKAIGQEENYHLILEADSAISSVVFFQNALDITPKVQARVNGGTPTASAAPAAATDSKPAASKKEKNKS